MMKWLIGSVIVLALVAGCTPAAGTRGQESRESLVKAYLTALQTGDAGAMLSLVGPAVDARAEVANALQHDGGQQLKDLTVSYLDEFGGAFIVATVNGLVASDGAEFQTTIPMGRENGRYYLALGKAPVVTITSDPSSPSAVP